jgi:hypothetical protein
MRLWAQGKDTAQGAGFIDMELPTRDNYNNSEFLTPGKQTMHGFMGMFCYLAHQHKSSFSIEKQKKEATGQCQHITADHSCGGFRVSNGMWPATAVAALHP